MLEYKFLIHYFAVGFSTIITAIGVSLGQSKLSGISFLSIDRQPAVKSELSKTTLLALALIETSALLGFIGSILLYFYAPENIYQAIAHIGYSIAISIPGLIIALSSSMPAQASLIAITKQVFISKKITNLMLLTQSLIQTPVIFGFIVALLILNNLKSVNSLEQAIIILASGIAISIGSLGPAFGVGRFTKKACYSVGQNKYAYSKLISFTVISQAIIETPVIFSVIISFWLLNSLNFANFFVAISSIASAFVISIGTLGPGFGSSKVACKAVEQITLDPQSYSAISRTSLIAQGIIDTGAIYAFIISIIILLRA